MPICRAAFGALEKLFWGALYSEMENRFGFGGPVREHRIRRWAREIVIAALLTIAAAGFITAALLRGNGSPPAAPYETARKPATP